MGNPDEVKTNSGDDALTKSDLIAMQAEFMKSFKYNNKKSSLKSFFIKVGVIVGIIVILIVTGYIFFLKNTSSKTEVTVTETPISLNDIIKTQKFVFATAFSKTVEDGESDKDFFGNYHSAHIEANVFVNIGYDESDMDKIKIVGHTIYYPPFRILEAGISDMSCYENASGLTKIQIKPFIDSLNKSIADKYSLLDENNKSMSEDARVKCQDEARKAFEEFCENIIKLTGSKESYSYASLASLPVNMNKEEASE